MDSHITLEKCTKALKELPNGKSPGSDGFTAEFYKMLWPYKSDLVTENYF